MIEHIIWLSIAFLSIASLDRFTKGESTLGTRPKFVPRWKFVLGGIGWILFSLHWITSIMHSFDMFRAILTLLMSIFCLIIAFHMLVAKEKHDVLLVLTKAAAIICLIYFPFAEIEILNEAIILVTARITGTTLNAVGVPVQVVHVQMPQSPYAIRLGGLQLGIILACTAIESMALFAGVILAVDALPKSKFKAFMVSVPVIYVLNIIRNVLVTTAYGYCWFGTPERSFDIAHSYLARIGSVLALMGIAYAVIMILPEVLDMLEGIMDLFRPIHRR